MTTRPRPSLVTHRPRPDEAQPAPKVEEKPAQPAARPVAPSRDTKESAVIDRARLNRSRGGVERLSAILVLVLSFLGTIAVFEGSWTPLLTLRPSLAAVGGGVLLQGILTWCEWAYSDNRKQLRYLVPLAVDTALTVWGYGPLIAPAIERWFTPRGIPEPMLAAWLIVALAALVLAWYPENRLIK